MATPNYDKQLNDIKNRIQDLRVKIAAARQNRDRTVKRLKEEFGIDEKGIPDKIRELTAEIDENEAKLGEIIAVIKENLDQAEAAANG